MLTSRGNGVAPMDLHKRRKSNLLRSRTTIRRYLLAQWRYISPTFPPVTTTLQPVSAIAFICCPPTERQYTHCPNQLLGFNISTRKFLHVTSLCRLKMPHKQVYWPLYKRTEMYVGCNRSTAHQSQKIRTITNIFFRKIHETNIQTGRHQPVAVPLRVST